MKSKYWIKLYHEILDDPKMGKLPDRLYRRTIECFLLAGDFDQGGFLPPLEDIAWRLHLDAEQLETDLIELQRIGLLDVIDGRWFVAKFAERQAADSNTERWQRWNERQRKGDYYSGDQPPTPLGDYTNDTQTSDQRPTNDMFADKDIDSEVEVDIESEAEAAVEGAGAADFPELVGILHAAGIYEPTATEIAKYPHVDARYLEAHIAKARSDKVNTKILITRLRAGDPLPLTPEQVDEQDRQRYVRGELAQYVEH